MSKRWLLTILLLAGACHSPSRHAPTQDQTKSASSVSTNAVDAVDDGGGKYAVEVASELVGKPAPALKLKTVDGETIDLGKLYGHKPIYLKFWATWCVPCREQMPHFEHSYEAAGDKMAVIAINTNFNETPEGVKAYRREHGLKMPIVIDDGQLAEALKLRVTPQHVVIDRDGRIAYVGHLANAALDAALAAAQESGATRPVAPAPGPASQLVNSLVALDGKRFALQDARRPTILMFLSPFCEGYIEKSQPKAGAECRSAREVSAKLAATSGARWIGIAWGVWADTKSLREYRDKFQVTMPLAVDTSGDVFRTHHVNRVPTIILVDTNGKEVQRLTGDMSGLPALLSRVAVASRSVRP